MKRIEKVSKVGEQVEIYYEDGPKQAISLETIKGGIAWPTPDSPAYFCILGKYSFPDENLKKKLILLSEAEADLPGDLFKQLYEDARKLRCFEFYGEITDCRHMDPKLESLSGKVIKNPTFQKIIDIIAGKEIEE